VLLGVIGGIIWDFHATPVNWMIPLVDENFVPWVTTQGHGD